MAFMAGPRLVLLDEPAGGVNPTMLAGLRERLREINAAQRATFVVIEHNMEFVMSLCTRVLVLAEGRIIAEGTPEEIRANPAVIEAYLGELAILVLEDVVAGYGGLTVLNGTSLQAARGAITTIIGPNGAGKSTVFKTVFGLLPARAGRIVFEGREVTNLSPRKLLELGISYVPQGRNIFPELSVRHNLELGATAARGRHRRRGAHRVGDGPLSDAARARRRAGVDALRRPAEAARDRAQPAARPEADADRRALDRAFAAAGAGDLRASCRTCARKA